MSKLAKLTGTACPYYLWLVERLGSRNFTRFYVRDACNVLDCDERTIRRFTEKLKKLGLIKVKRRLYNGMRTYNEYVLLPVNDIIQDWGVKTQKQVEAVGADLPLLGGKAVPNVGTKLPEQREPETERERDFHLSSASLAPDRFERSGDGSRPIQDAPVSASPEPVKDEHAIVRTSISSWCKENNAFLASCGLHERTDDSLTLDALRHFMQNGDPALVWKEFVEIVWPRLRLKLPTVDFIRKKQHTLGTGWIFKANPKKGNEPFYLTIIASNQYGGITLPDVLYSVGDRVKTRRYGVQLVKDVVKEGYILENSPFAPFRDVVGPADPN